MGSGILGTNVLAGHGFFGFDPTRGSSASRTVGNVLGGNLKVAADGNAPAPAAKAAAPAPSQQQGAAAANSVYTAPGGYTGSSTNSAAASAAQAAQDRQNAANVAQYQDQINALNQLLGSADITQGNGVNSINTSFNNQNSRLNQQQSDTLSKYATQKQDTTTDYGKTIGKINTNARNGYNSLQMLLGGTGSAGEILAPYAVSTQANSQRGESSDAFARNLRDIDTAVTDANTKYKNAQDDLLGQKNGKLQALLSSIDGQKMNYRQQLAAAQSQLNVAKGGGYVTPAAQNSAIAALLADQQRLGQQYADPQFAVQNVQTITPDMAAYQAQAAQLAGQDNVSDGTDDTAAALQALLKKPDTANFSY